MKQNYNDWIDAYLRGQLNDSELAEFETKIQTDKDFAKELVFQMALRKEIAKDKIATYEAKRVKDIKRRRWFLWGLGILGLFFFISSILYFYKPPPIIEPDNSTSNSNNSLDTSLTTQDSLLNTPPKVPEQEKQRNQIPSQQQNSSEKERNQNIKHIKSLPLPKNLPQLLN